MFSSMPCLPFAPPITCSYISRTSPLNETTMLRTSLVLLLIGSVSAHEEQVRSVRRATIVCLICIQVPRFGSVLYKFVRVQNRSTPYNPCPIAHQMQWETIVSCTHLLRCLTVSFFFVDIRHESKARHYVARSRRGASSFVPGTSSIHGGGSPLSPTTLVSRL